MRTEAPARVVIAWYSAISAIPQNRYATDERHRISFGFALAAYRKCGYWR